MACFDQAIVSQVLAWPVTEPGAVAAAVAELLADRDLAGVDAVRAAVVSGLAEKVDTCARASSGAAAAALPRLTRELLQELELLVGGGEVRQRVDDYRTTRRVKPARLPQSTVTGQRPSFVFDPTFHRQVIRPPVFARSPAALEAPVE